MFIILANRSKMETASEYFFSFTKSVAFLKSLSELVTSEKKRGVGVHYQH